jgi:hypothetical protein
MGFSLLIQIFIFFDVIRQKKRREWLCCRFSGENNALVRRELLGNLTAALRQAFLIERVEHLFAPALGTDEVGILEHLQVMRDGRLCYVKRVDDVANTEPLATAQGHNLLARLVGERLGKLNSVDGSRLLSYRRFSI